MRGLVLSLLTAWLAFFGCQPASGQTLLIRVSEAESGRPIPGAFVTLRDGSGRDIQSALTGSEGRHRFRLPAAGRWSVRAQMIGRKTAETTPARVDLEQELVLDLRLAVSAIEMRGITVEGSARCALRPAEGEATAALWEEARKALEVTAWGIRESILWYQLRHWTREYGPDDRRALAETDRVVAGYHREPFQSLPALDLVEGGFLRETQHDTLAYAPDAEVLLSDLFLDTHCFRVRRSAEQSLLGLGFEPVNRRSRADIEGVLWLDSGTHRLRSLEFRYTGPDAERLVPGGGGRVDFEFLPSGAWIVRSWHIRMPVMGEIQRRVARGFVLGTEPVGWVEEGGEVLRARDREGQEIAAWDGAVLTGRVHDGMVGVALAGARVLVAGTRWEARTARDGSFRITGLPDGIWTVEVHRPASAPAGPAVPPTEVELEAGQTVWVDLVVPGLVVAATPKRAADATDAPGRAGAAGRPAEAGSLPPGRLVGRVVASETGSPLGEVAITLPGLGPSVLSGSEGRFAFAEVQPGRHAIRAQLLGRNLVEDTVTLASGEVLEIELRLPLEPIAVQGILVEVERRESSLEMVGFYERRVREQGVFLTQEQIEERNPASLVDLFEGIPGVRVIRSGIRRTVSLAGSRAVSLSRNPCYPTVWLDDQPILSPDNREPVFFDDLVRPSDIAAMEIYPSTARIPVQYNLGGACGVIVIWTRRR